jgi:hypothetical protein
VKTESIDETKRGNNGGDKEAKILEILHEQGPRYTHANKLPHINPTEPNKDRSLNEILMKKDTPSSPQRNSQLVVEHIH